VITVKDFTKEGKICWKKIPTLQISDVMFCILCQGQWKATKLLAQAKLMVKASKMQWKSSAGGESAPIKNAKSSNAHLSVICELCHVAAFYSQVYIFMKVERVKIDL
jgi:hypothetical protein